jgi:glycosyltransferase involved in cell wall biosynthesis
LYYDVTVLHSGKASSQNEKYNEIIVPVKKVFVLNFQKGVLSEIKKNYSVIIAMSDLHWINSYIALFTRPKKVKFIWWGAWFTDKKIIDYLKVFFAKKANANIFYSKSHKDDFLKKGVSDSLLFVANNTFDVGARVKSYEEQNKNYILFVGTLNQRKQNDVLIEAFSRILYKIDKKISLIFIGKGEIFDDLKKIVSNYRIESRVIFNGEINDVEKLKTYYQKAIVSVSFGQAGLSVLQSLGYGVPFITSRNAISGGEKFNIIDGKNGFFCDNNVSDLEEKLLLMCTNNQLAQQMGKNAFDYYSENCTMENMVNGFVNAIQKVTKEF